MSILINSDGTWKDVTEGGGGTGVVSGSSQVIYPYNGSVVSGKIVSWYKYGRVVMLVIPSTLTGSVYSSSVPRPITNVKYEGMTGNTTASMIATLTIKTDGTLKFGFYERQTNEFDINDIFTYTYISLE